MATIREIADLAGVSKATVSRVLNGKRHISEATSRRVRDAAERLGYPITPTAVPSRRPNRTGNFGAIFTQYPGSERTSANIGVNLQNPSWSSEALQGIETLVREAGFNVFVTSMSLLRAEDPLPLFVQQQQVDGVFVLGGVFSRDYLQKLVDAGVAVVIVGGCISLPNVHCVYADNYRGAYLLAEHLLTQGCRHVGLINGPNTTNTSQDKLFGYRSALERHGFDWDGRLVSHADFTETSGYETIKYWHEEGLTVDGVVCGHVLQALGVYQYCDDRELHIPRDLAVVGFEGGGSVLRLEPQLTSVRWFNREMGMEAAQRMFQILDGRAAMAARTILPIEMKIGSSCGSGLDGISDEAHKTG